MWQFPASVFVCAIAFVHISLFGAASIFLAMTLTVMQKLDRETKKAGKIIKEMYPNENWFINRIDSQISKGWTPVLKVEVHEGDVPTKLRWNNAALVDTTIDTGEVATKFAATTRERTQVHWSV